MSDELTRAITEALGCEESSFYGVGVCVAHGPGWPCRKAEDVAAALAPLIEARVREARAEGAADAYADVMRRAADESMACRRVAEDARNG